MIWELIDEELKILNAWLKGDSNGIACYSVEKFKRELKEDKILEYDRQRILQILQNLEDLITDLESADD